MKELKINGYTLLFDDEDYYRLVSEDGRHKIAIVLMKGVPYAKIGNTTLAKSLMNTESTQKIFSRDGNKLNFQKANLYHKTDADKSSARKSASINYYKRHKIPVSREETADEVYTDDELIKIQLKMKMRVIVNTAIANEGSWYLNGQQRLYESLRSVGDTTNFVMTQTRPDGHSPYWKKLQTIIDAYKMGYKQILWLDCSITATTSLDPIWDYIENNGYYLYASGFNCAQTANDRCLNNFGLVRDTVESWPECASNVIGINTEHWAGEKIIKELMQSHIPVSIKGNKWPNENERMAESMDPRFLFHRQDQTIMSLIAGKYKLPLEDHNHFVMRDENGNEPSDTVIFKLKGGY